MNASRFVQQLLHLDTPPLPLGMAWPFPEDEFLVTQPQQEITGETAREHGIQITHIRPDQLMEGYEDWHFPGATIAYRPTTEFNNCRMVEVAVAYCSPHDTFSKKQGTSLATQKFLSGETIKVPARNPSKPDRLPITLRKIFRILAV